MAINSQKPLDPEKELARHSRRSFIALGAGAVVAGAGWFGIEGAINSGEIPAPLQGALGLNEKVARAALFSDSHLTKTYPASAIGKLKTNGDIGVDTPIDQAAWKLQVTGGPQLTIADIRSLPRFEETIDFKCVEGWSTVTQFAGARLADFTAKFAPGPGRADYVFMDTPDKEFYVGLDMPSALHPQTLLAYEMNGAPLMEDHGAPLRLVIPVKYGIKNIKRIARIEYTNDRPKDYWADQGYDWYAGL